jgi:hypothetical protein
MQPTRILTAFAILLVPFWASCRSGGPTPSSAPGPAIAVDPKTCEASVETLATIDGSGTMLVRHLTAAPDGTVYYLRDDIYDQGGIYAIDPGGGAPRRISTYAFGDRVWVDGDSLLVANFGKIVVVPRAGGDAQNVGAIPNADAIGDAWPDADAHAFDGQHVYIVAMTRIHGGGERNDVWRIPKKGGDAELLFSSTEDTYNGLWMGQLTFDADSLYIGAGGPEKDAVGVLMRMPKSGGTPQVLRTNAYDPITRALVLFDTDLYAPAFYGPLTRWPLDPSAPATVIEGADRKSGDTVGLVADGAGAYVAVLTHDETNEAVKSIHARTAFARIPNGVEHTTSIGCTEGRDFPPNLGWNVTTMALDPTHLYALAYDVDRPHDSRRFVILRMAR